MLIVFSDLDGCLLDEGYSCTAAQPALDALRHAGVPLVLCSSKTRSEMEALARRLSLAEPLVFENGGGIVLPAGSERWRSEAPATAALIALGIRRERLIEALPGLAREAGARVRGFSQMDADEVVALTGLGRDEAARALEREFDEPFVTVDSCGRDLALDRRLDLAARRRGLRVTHGGRLHHLHGPSDKGCGVRAVLAHWRGPSAHTIGLGDAATDLPLLRAVERPILVPGRQGFEPLLLVALPRAGRAPLPGPRGWNAAVLAAVADWRERRSA